MAARSKVKANAIQPPQNQEEAEVLLGSIGSLQRRVTESEVSMNDQIAAVKDRYRKKAEELTGSISEQFKRLHVWAEANKSMLLPGKKKSADLSTGKLSWRKTPPKVNVKNTEAAIEELKATGLHRFIKTTEVIDKEAILAEKDEVELLEQISVSQRTEFVAKPHDTDIETVGKVKE